MARRALQRAPGPGLHNWHDYKDVCLLSGAALRLLFTLTSAPLCACRDLRVFGTHRLNLESSGAAVEPWDLCARAASHRALCGESVKSSGAAAEPCMGAYRASRIQQSPQDLKRAFSGVYSLPEPPRSPGTFFARAASNIAVT